MFQQWAGNATENVTSENFPPSKFSGIIPTVFNNYLKHFNQRPNSYGKIHRLVVYVLKKTNNLVIRPLSVVAQKNGMKTKNIEAVRIVDIAFACFLMTLTKSKKVAFCFSMNSALQFPNNKQT